jgi:hypothetical protein
MLPYDLTTKGIFPMVDELKVTPDIKFTRTVQFYKPAVNWGESGIKDG